MRGPRPLQGPARLTGPQRVRMEAGHDGPDGQALWRRSHEPEEPARPGAARLPLVVAAAACGGGDDDDAAPTTTVAAAARRRHRSPRHRRRRDAGHREAPATTVAAGRGHPELRRGPARRRADRRPWHVPRSRDRLRRRLRPRQRLLISPDGLAVTNNHVVAGAATLEVYVGGELDESYNATILGVSECNDLALIDINGPDDMPHLEWFDGDVPRRARRVRGGLSARRSRVHADARHRRQGRGRR